LKDLAKRVSVAVWGIPLVLILSYLGDVYFLTLILIINGMALWEFYSLPRRENIFPYRELGTFLGTLFLLFVFWRPEWYSFLIFAILILFLLFQLTVQSGIASQNTAFTITGFAYITVFLSTALFLRNDFSLFFNDRPLPLHAGGLFVIIIWASIWICDTAAYFGGRFTGKHKLAPTISPNKTVEGAIWGFIFGTLTFWLLARLFLPGISDIYFLLNGILVGIFGQIGDLVESRFKRDAGVKDTSSILPGHGGFLDRFDSFIFISPFLYILLKSKIW